MLGSNKLVATFALCLLISFTEISQGSENHPKNLNANEGMFGLNDYKGFTYVWRSFNVVLLVIVNFLFTRHLSIAREEDQVSGFVSGN